MPTGTLVVNLVRFELALPVHCHSFIINKLNTTYQPPTFASVPIYQLKNRPPTVNIKKT